MCTAWRGPCQPNHEAGSRAGAVLCSWGARAKRAAKFLAGSCMTLPESGGKPALTGRSAQEQHLAPNGLHLQVLSLGGFLCPSESRRCTPAR